MKNIVLFIIVLICFTPLSLFSQPAGKAPAPQVTPAPDVTALLKQLGSPKLDERIRARSTLVRLGDNVVSRIIQALPSAPPLQAYELIMTLYNLGYQGDGEVLKEVWRENNDKRVKLAAAMLLCRLDEDYSLYQEYIVARANEGEESDRLLAMQMLGYVKDPRTVPILKEIFYDESQPDQIRQAAVWDLSFTPCEESARVLVEMVNDPAINWFYKEILITGIRRLASEPDMAPLVSDLLEKAQGLPSLRKQSQTSP